DFLGVLYGGPSPPEVSTVLGRFGRAQPCAAQLKRSPGLQGWEPGLPASWQARRSLRAFSISSSLASRVPIKRNGPRGAPGSTASPLLAPSLSPRIFDVSAFCIALVVHALLKRCISAFRTK